MAAFDRIRCGFPELDEILDYIRLGDNVVWQVTDIGEFSMFARPFVRQDELSKTDAMSLTCALPSTIR